MLDDLAVYQARVQATLRHMARAEDVKGVLWIMKRACIPKYLALCVKAACTKREMPRVELLCEWRDLTQRHTYHRILGW